MSESDGNRKRAISSASTEDGSAGMCVGASSTVTTALFTTFSPPLAANATPAGSNKKRQKRGTRAPNATAAQINVPPGVVISRSAEDCAPQLNLSKLIVTGNRGFRMARATHGVSHGTWYWECTVLPPETKEGHCRLGWSLPTGSLQAPVGYDKSSYAYRDIAGSKVHESLRTDNYGEPWGPGDVIGFMIKLKTPSPEELRDAPDADPDSGRLSVAAAAATLAAGGGSSSERGAGLSTPAAGIGANTGNEIRFFKNGKDQNVAFSGIKPGLYFPAVSVYMGGSVRVNFGPEFVYPLPSSYRCKPIASLRPLSKDEAKAQRTRTKQERAARGLETATRQSAGGSYLGSTSRSPPRSSPWQPLPANPAKGSSSAQQRGGNGNDAGGTRAPKSDGNRDLELAGISTAMSHAETTEGQVLVGEATRASSPPAGSGPKERKGSARNGGDEVTKTEPEAAKAGDTEVLPGGTPSIVGGVVNAADRKGSGTERKGVPSGKDREAPAAATAMRDFEMEEVISSGAGIPGKLVNQGRGPEEYSPSTLSEMPRKGREEDTGDPISSYRKDGKAMVEQGKVNQRTSPWMDATNNDGVSGPSPKETSDSNGGILARDRGQAELRAPGGSNTPQAASVVGMSTSDGEPNRRERNEADEVETND